MCVYVLLLIRVRPGPDDRQPQRWCSKLPVQQRYTSLLPHTPHPTPHTPPPRCDTEAKLSLRVTTGHYEVSGETTWHQIVSFQFSCLYFREMVHITM